MGLHSEPFLECSCQPTVAAIVGIASPAATATAATATAIAATAAFSAAIGGGKQVKS